MRPILLATFVLLSTLAGAQEPSPVAQGAPASHFSLLSWNVQTFGSVNPTRQAAAKSAYAAVVTTNVYVMAVQEIANERGMETFLALLPGGTTTWAASFVDTPDSQDNAIVYRIGYATITATGFLFADAETGEPDRTKAVHPIRWAHVDAGGVDFTLLSLHLTFKGGDAAASKAEMRAVLDWLKDYLKTPGADPDVIIAGDFNLPSEMGKTMSARSQSAKWFTLDSIIAEDGRFATGSHRLTVLVNDPTSRPSKKPVNNYDHFVVTEDARKALHGARRVPIGLVDQADARSKVRVSDHYPIEGWFSKDAAAQH